MELVDLKYARFIKEAQDIGAEMIERAKKQTQDDPRAAAKTLVSAWVVLNGAAAVCHDQSLHTQAAKLETLRQKIKFMGGELATMGYSLVTDVPDSQVALVVTPKEPPKKR